MKQSRIGFLGACPKFGRHTRGFTVVELMIVVVIVAIGVALALPSWQSIVEKRQLTSAAEQLTSFIDLARSEAVKRNEEVRVSWIAAGGHSADFCIGFSTPPKSIPCDCRVTTATAANYCSVGASAADQDDGMDYRLTKTDFVDIGKEFMHMNPRVANFGFDPVRGIVVNTSDNEILDNDWLFYVHSDQGSGSTRLFELRMHMNVTGRFKICYEAGRRMVIGGYPRC